MKTFLGIAILALLASAISAIPAFPGAEGWGADAVGGRNGQIIHVTSLNNSGTGTLRAACGVSGAKIIVFDVSGVIDCQSSPVMMNSNTTIAGQTSPGGITLTSGALYCDASSNIIVRHMRVRRSVDEPDGDCFRFSTCHEVIVDHCSVSWCSDELIDIGHSYNVTIMASSVSEPGYCSYSYGGQPGDGLGNDRTAFFGAQTDGRVTLYRCLFAHAKQRVPCLTNYGETSPTGKTYELINNAFYNDGGGYESFYMNNNVPLNLIGNWYYKGPNAQHQGQQPATMYIHSSANYRYPSATSSEARFQKVYFMEVSAKGFVDSAFLPKKTNTVVSAVAAFSWIAAAAGTLPRDSADKRIVSDAQHGTGAWVDFCNPPATHDPYITTGPAKPADSDNDGIPNAWETAHGLNPNSAADAMSNIGGYNAIEVYINALSDTLAQQAVREFSAGIENGPAGGQESRLLSAAPNPLKDATEFHFALPAGAKTKLAIYALSGRKIREWNFKGSSAISGVRWDGKNRAGIRAAAGVYVCRLQNGNRRESIRLLVAK